MRVRRGFSIIEIVVVMAIVAGAFVLVLPWLNELRGVNLDRETHDLVRLIKGTFDDAGLFGQTHRIVFEIKTDKDTNAETTTYWVEASKAEARAGASVKEDEEGGLLIGTQDSDKAAKEKYKRKTDFVPVKNDYGQRHVFRSSVRLRGVWVEGMEDRLREGTVYLYFSPLGGTQRAQISLGDDSTTMVVSVEPLTGEVSVENGEKPIP